MFTSNIQKCKKRNEPGMGRYNILHYGAFGLLTPIKAVLLFRRIRNVCLLNFSPLLLSNFGQTKLIPRRSVTVCETLTNCNDEMLFFLKMANPDLFFVLFSFQHQIQFQFQHCKSKKALMVCLGFEPG